MDKVHRQLLRDPGIPPTEEVLKEALGPSMKAFELFLQKLQEEEIQVTWRYYEDGKSWLAKGLYVWMGPRGGHHETTLLWVSIWSGFFKVTLYFPEKSRKQLILLPVVDAVKTRIQEAQRMGKLRSFPMVFEVRDPVDLEDLTTLIGFKKTLK